MKRNLLYLFTLLMLTTTVFLQEQGSLAGCNRASGPANLLLAEDHRLYIIALQKPDGENFIAYKDGRVEKK